MPRDDDDEDQDRPIRRRRREIEDLLPPTPPSDYIQPFPSELLMIGKVLLVLLSGAIALAALNGNSIQAAGLAGLACVIGITARLLQAEEHFTIIENRRRYEDELRQYEKEIRQH